MSAGLLGIVCIIYWVVAVDQWIAGSPSGFVVWAAYGTANLGLIWQLK